MQYLATVKTEAGKVVDSDKCKTMMSIEWNNTSDVTRARSEVEVA